MFEVKYENDKRMFYCKQCTAKYTTKLRVSSHFKVKHMGIVTIYKCEKCDMNFKGRDVFTQHVKTHEPHSFICVTCNQTFVRDSEFKRHQRTDKCRRKKGQ
uniref:Zinc finger and BTB domain-containing protein 47 n=1 Tax=Culex pipiens TaxID=7175 RepID=A0A8D8C6P8_CULPI